MKSANYQMQIEMTKIPTEVADFEFVSRRLIMRFLYEKYDFIFVS